MTLRWPAHVVVAMLLVACGGEIASTPGDSGAEREWDSSSGDSGAVAVGDDSSSIDANVDDVSAMDVGAPGLDAGTPDAGILPELGFLQLWVRADVGLQCDTSTIPARVTSWADQSFVGRKVAPLHELGPECQVAGHTFNGVVLPWFSAPPGNDVDESLDVDLSFLVGADYTIFVVERRWSDRPTYNMPPHGDFLIGTDVSDPADLYCTGGTPPDSALQFGYVFYNGAPQLVIDHTCANALATVQPTPNPPPAPMTYDMARFSTGSGQEVWQDGALVAASGNDQPLTAANDGAIGRAVIRTDGDGRFIGDIAEVIVYNERLSDPQRLQVEAWLKGHWGL